ncbi:S8 family peptidase [Corallococcus coralloides]|uniref:S8 family peptidase n=1 Tax=Corallococcus coralloides TaxID=184914 RepID=UPI0038509AFF
MPRHHRLNEVVIELRLDEKFLAKSHHPDKLLQAAGLEVRGVGSWVQHGPARGAKATEGELKTYNSRSLYVSGNLSAIKALQHVILHGSSKGPQRDIEKVDSDVTKLEGIRLPKPSEHSSAMGKVRQAVEVVLFGWDGQLHDEALDRVRRLLAKYRVPTERTRIKVYDNGPTFIAAVVPPEVLKELGEYNFLRAVRHLPRIQLTRQIVRSSLQGFLPLVAAGKPRPRLAVFDGGYAKGNPILDPYVEVHDCTPMPALQELLEHGRMVISSAVLGPVPEDGIVLEPKCRVLSYRVLPDAQGDDELEMYGVVDALEKYVPKLPPDVKVVNLSLGPPGPIDRVPSRLTYAIDRLTREHEVLFFIAAGNEGHVPGRERVQAPADAVNNMGVGAFQLNAENEPEPASYSSRGPGRSGAITKPDLVAFGGCPARPFYVLGPTPGVLQGVAGTSCSTPCVASLSAGVVTAVASTASLTPEAQRALLIHTAKKMKGVKKQQVGYGRAADNVEEVLACSSTRVSVLYQGYLSPRDSWKLPFLLPPDFDGNGKVDFSWTLVFSPEVDLGSPDEYALGGLEIKFRPHSDEYYFSEPTKRGEDREGERVLVNIHQEAARARELTRLGWKKSVLPASDTPTGGKKEQYLREVDGKWETVVRDHRGKMPGGLSEPMLTLVVLGRRSWDKKDKEIKARYAAVLTVDAPKYKGDLYQAVVRSFPKLQPLLRPQTRGPSGRLRT